MATIPAMIKTICDHYDEKLQKLVACEELGELIQEISKSVRQGKNYDVNDMISEIADVYIIIYELTYMHSIEADDISSAILAKLDRQMERIRNEGQHDN